MASVISIILGGGRGTRLFPLTRDRSKPAVPIGGKYRLVDIPISNSINSGIRKIFVLTQFNSVSLHRHISRAYRFDHFSDSNLGLLAAEQTLDNAQWFQGTADAVRKHMPHYHLEDEDDVLILSGDHLYRMDFQEILQYLHEKDADFVVAAVPVKKSEVDQFGILKMNKDGRITNFKEKPKEALAADMHEGNFLASMGIYAFKAKILKQVLMGDETDFGKQVIPNSLQKYKAYGYTFDGYWRDIGTISSYYEASLDLTAEHTPFQFFLPGKRIFTRPRFLPPLQIIDAQIKNSTASEGCILHQSKINHCILGLRTYISEGCVIKDSVIIGADYYDSDRPGRKKVALGIGKNCKIERAILDKNVRIGEGVVIRDASNRPDFDGDNYYIRDGIVVIPKNAIIQPGTVI